MAAEYKKKVGFKGTLLLEPKPQVKDTFHSISTALQLSMLGHTQTARSSWNCIRSALQWWLITVLWTFSGGIKGSYLLPSQWFMYLGLGVV